MSRYHIEVTQEHIDRAEDDCPVLLATREVLPLDLRVAVVDSNGAFSFSDRAIGTWANEKETSLFMGRFDEGLPVQPFTAILDTRFPQ